MQIRKLAVLAAVALIFNSAHAQDAKVTLDIKPQPIRLALQSFGEQSGLQVLFRSEGLAIDGLTSPQISGELSAQEALDRLLNNTGLRYEFVNPHTVRISSAATTSDKTSSNDQGTAEKTSLHLAQSDSPVPQDSGQSASGSSENSQNSQNQSTASLPSSEGKESRPLEEVVVTGTHIVGVNPVTPVIQITRDDILSSGFSSVGEALMALPENFAGGNNPTVAGVGGQGVNGGRSNTSNAYTANLRGIGAGATLTLVDGHRLAFDGSAAGVDLSLIPLVAVERIEVATDGASAIYGADAVAGVVNIILKKNYDGIRTSAHLGATPDGGAFSQLYSQSIGKTFGTGAFTLAYEYSDNDNLKSTQRDISSGTATPFDLSPSQRQHSAFGSARYDLTENLSTNLEAVYAHRDSKTLQTPSSFEGKVGQFGAAAGVDYNLGGRRSITLDFTAAGNNQTTTISSLTTPTPPSSTSLRTRLYGIELKAQGPVVQIPTGDISLAAGVGLRRETLLEPLDPTFTRNVSDAYLEANAPLIAPSSHRAGLNRLDLDLAARYEHYDEFGSSTDPRFGIAYSPSPSLTVKASWGKSFRAPTLDQMNSGAIVSLYRGAIFGVTSPPQATVLFAGGSNPDLQPETSRSFTGTLEFSPTSVRGLLGTFTYYSIDYDGRIATPISSPLTALRNPLYAPFSVRQPSAALQAEFVSRATQFFNNTSSAYDPSNVAALILDDLQNVSSQKISGIDGLITYDWESAWGHWNVGTDATWLRFTQRTLPASAIQTIDGTIFNPPKFKSRSSVKWKFQAWSASAFLNYISSESDVNSTPAAHVASWVTIDAQLQYVVPQNSSFLNGLAVSVSTQNLINRMPPKVGVKSTLPTGVGFDAANAAAFGRTIGLFVSKVW